MQKWRSTSPYVWCPEFWQPAHRAPNPLWTIAMRFTPAARHNSHIVTFGMPEVQKKTNLYCSIVLPLRKNRLKVRLLKLVLANRGWWESTLNNGETKPIESNLRHHSACPTNIGFSDGPLVTSLSSLRQKVKLTIAVYQAAWVQVRELVAHL